MWFWPPDVSKGWAPLFRSTPTRGWLVAAPARVSRAWDGRPSEQVLVTVVLVYRYLLVSRSFSYLRLVSSWALKSPITPSRAPRERLQLCTTLPRTFSAVLFKYRKAE